MCPVCIATAGATFLGYSLPPALAGLCVYRFRNKLKFRKKRKKEPKVNG